VSLPHVLLALLADEAATGYALKKRIDAELSPLWSAELSQIYPVLENLSRADFLSGRVVGPARGPGSVRLRPTAAGRRELARWLAESPAPPTLRDESLVRAVLLFAFGDPGGNGVHAYERTLAEEQARLRREPPAGSLPKAARDAALATVEALRRWARGRAENPPPSSAAGRGRAEDRRGGPLRRRKIK
jgi:DNA-binding PadR family transcriptional regulator